MCNKVLLSIVITPSIEDAFVDLLLEHDAVKGFTSVTVNGHGVSAHSLSPAEKVVGYQRQLLFQTYLSQQNVQELINSIKQHFSDSGIHYWLTPVINTGQII